MDVFKLARKRQYSNSRYPVIRLNRDYYERLARLRSETGLTFSALVESCMDFALARLELVDIDKEDDEDADT